MTQLEAFAYLGIDSELDSKDAIELKIFEYKKQIIAQNHIPQLLFAKLEKLLKLKQVISTLNITYASLVEQIDIFPSESDSLIETFNVYHLNKTNLLQRLSNSTEVDIIINCVRALSENLKIWSSRWPNLKIDSIDRIKLSSELDSMQLLSILKELKSQDILIFKNLHCL